MSSNEILKYELKYFNDIKNTSSFVISDDTIKLIQELSDKLTILNKSNNSFEKKNFNKKNSNNENWNTIKNFKTTNFVKKEGLDKNINTIRINLNKITNKNYNILSIKIFDEIDIHKNNTEFLNSVKNLLIETASNINIYSEIYVTLYKSFLEKYDKNVLNLTDNFNTLKNDIINIKKIDSKINYDEFCKNNKNNDKKRNLCLFYINLMKQNLISKEEIINLIIDIQNINLNLINNIDNNLIIDELCEILYVLIKNSLKNINDNDNFSIIYTNIKHVITLTKNENNSLTTKSKFKHMDILDLINKNNI